MARSSYFRHWRNLALLCCLASFIAFTGFKLVLRSFSRSSQFISGSGVASPSLLRAKLYDELSKDLDVHGASFLSGGQTSQSLLLSDIFELDHGEIKPKLKPLDTPVRANVLHMKVEYAKKIAQTVRGTFLPFFDKAIWFQNTSLYHSSLFHASHHVSPVAASDAEVEAEAYAIKSVARSFCPLNVILDRVVLTSTGVLLGCWQVTSGTDPFTIRTKLKEVLPRSPKMQFYDPVLLHTSLARLLGPPKMSAKEIPTDRIKLLHDLVSDVNIRLKHFQAVVSELWFVEEFDMLALALNGRMKIHKFHLGCLAY